MHLDVLRAFVLIVETGSLNRAAERLRVAQSTLTRQVQALESELGGRLLERTAGGVVPTAAGHALLRGLRPALAELDRVLQTAGRRARGQSDTLRIGYIGSATACLTPALSAVRHAHPEVKVTLADLTPGEQIRALEKGDIDVALTGQTGALLSRDFHVRRLGALPVWVAMAPGNPLAKKKAVPLAALQHELFVSANDTDVPGYDRWVAQLCRRAGFKPKFLHGADSLAQGMAMIVAESAVALQPEFVKDLPFPGVVFRRLTDPAARWEMVVAWQRGLATAPLRTLVEALPKTGDAA